MVRVGFVAGEEKDDVTQMKWFAEQVAAAHRASVEARQGTEEALMRALEDGDVDLVVGVFPKASPWSQRVALTSSVIRQDTDSETPVLRGAVHRGENRWLLGIERLIEDGKK